MRYLLPFALFSCRTAAEEKRLPHHISEWKEMIQMVRDRGGFDPYVTSQQNTLNNIVTHLKTEVRQAT